MIWMTDKDGNTIFVNEGWIEFTGKKKELEMGHGWEAGIYPEDLQKGKETFNEAMAEKKEFFLEYRLKRHDGKYRWLSEKGSPRYSGSGEFEGFIGTCMDIDEIKEHERRKDDFIIIASHELKTPITSIKGYVQLLVAMFKDYERTRILPPESSVRSSLTTIEKQVNKLTRLLAELLDLSKIETGNLDLEKTVFNLNDLVAETIDEIQLTAPNHVISLSNGDSYKVFADRDRIAQVILNLLTNAVKYSPEAAKVEVKVYDDKNGQVTVSVSDQGIGIDKQEHSRIFERFYRVEGKEEQTYPGFGIGLFIASEIIARHESKLAVKSETGKGAEFSFSLLIANN
jgi:PAS domain S-box-containing protein